MQPKSDVLFLALLLLTFLLLVEYNSNVGEQLKLKGYTDQKKVETDVGVTEYRNWDL